LKNVQIQADEISPLSLVPKRDIIENDTNEYSEIIHVAFFPFYQLIVPLKLPYNLKLRTFVVRSNLKFEFVIICYENITLTTDLRLI